MLKNSNIFQAVALCLLAAPLHAETVRFTLGTENNSSALNVQAMHRWADAMRDASGGELDMTIVDGGALGSGAEVLQQLSTDEIQVSTSGPTLLATMAKPYQCMEAEYVYDNADHGYRVWTGALGQELSDYMVQNYNIAITGIGLRGARQITANKAVHTPEDMKGVKIRVTNPLRTEIFAAMGALPGPLPYSELYGALRQGVFDAQENPIGSIHAQKLYEVQSAVSLTNHVESYYVVTTNSDFLVGLSEAHRKIFDETSAEAMNWLNTQVAADEARQLEEIKAAGAEIVESDIEAFRAVAAPIVAKFAAENCRPGILDDIAAAR